MDGRLRRALDLSDENRRVLDIIENEFERLPPEDVA